MIKITAIYDNGGKTIDRYTVVTNDRWNNGSRVAALGLSSNPGDYNGFSQWTGAIEGVHLGNKITFESLDGKVQVHIAKRVFEIGVGNAGV